MTREIKKSCNFSEIYHKTMESYCASLNENTANKNLSVKKTKQNRLMLLSNCAICSKKKCFSLQIKNFTVLIIFEMISLK